MFSSLLSSQKGPRSERTPLLATLRRYGSRQTGDPSADEDDDVEEDIAQYDGEDEDDEDNGFHGRDGPLLPVFSEFLDRLPIYSTTHAIRILVIQRCETTLSWDQLRSPQVSQFLVKPIQQQILAENFNRGTLYCLLANCLQFRKEGNDNPGMVGVSTSRALICELLAMRLLKEFSTRELIDALSYDFDPLQGMALPTAAGTVTPGGHRARQTPRSARISTLELAIRAQAKKFLAHPLVVQQLEAIWAGTIVFHSTADSLHRVTEPKVNKYGTAAPNALPGRRPSQQLSPIKQAPNLPRPVAMMRRTVTLYDPHHASLFKLSRLRVPRYRSLFSTLSFAIMLGLFLAVLAERSDDITALEVLFWFWSSGYMLDEIVGWSEQGFGLYILSFWNAFDLGILFMFLVYYVLRLYGILIDVSERHYIARMAYDVLGATAVLLFPRLFSALDHYRYFSQLLIAFRMMAMDLVAILFLIVICCSGFFVAFTLAFKTDLDAPNAAYALFQMLMGFTPAAWDIWADFNPLGKALLTLFLFICHFLIVTILITVLTNSFMAIVQNANEEHQFLFAVNTISMVKSDALFSYIAPTNIFGWLVIPLKYCMPFRQFVRMNRLIIKLTHIPILFSIFCYERLLLSNLAYEPTDLVERRGRSRAKVAVPAFSIRGAADLFSPGARLREPSITTFQKDRALEEVFRRPYRDPSIRGPASQPSLRKKRSTVVNDWMKGMGSDDYAFPPQEDTRSIVDQPEGRKRPLLKRAKTAGHIQRRRKPSFVTRRTMGTDPDESLFDFDRPIVEEEEPDMSIGDLRHQTDAEGDDELATNDDEDGRAGNAIGGPQDSLGLEKNSPGSDENSEDDFFRTPMTIKARTPAMSSSHGSPGFPGFHTSPNRSSPKKSVYKAGHARNWSNNTIVFSPTKETSGPSSRSISPTRLPPSGNRSGTATPGRMTTDARPTPKRAATTGRPRPIMPPQTANRTTTNFAGFLALDQRRRNPSFNTRALDLASDLGDNRHVPDLHGNLSGLPASFTTQLEMAARARARKGSDDESNRMSRIMLARMTTLEEGFRDVLNEVKGLRRGSDDGLPSRNGSKVGLVSRDGSKAGLNITGNSPPQEQVKKRKGKKKGGKKEDYEDRLGASL